MNLSFYCDFKPTLNNVETFTQSCNDYCYTLLDEVAPFKVRNKAICTMSLGLQTLSTA